MTDFEAFRALAAEHNAVPAYLFTGPGEGNAVLVRVFTDPGGGLRITMEDGKSINQQLVLDAEAMRALPSEPPIIGDS
jgi:hypothetical protein